MRRRSAASASRAWVSAFSFTSSRSRAASHSCGDTVGCVFIVRSPPSGSGTGYARDQGCGSSWPPVLLTAGSLAEVVLQCVQSAVPVTGQGGQELLGNLNGGGAESVAHSAPLARLGRHQ